MVGDARYASLRDAPRSHLYLPYAQHYRAGVTLHVRTGRNPTALVAPARDVLRQLDPAVALFDVTTLDNVVAGAVMTAAGGGAMLAGSFGLVGFALALLGMYGLMSYAAATRRHEVGVRIALGATRRDVVALFMRRGLRLTTIGLAAGLLMSVGLGRVIGSLLIRVSPLDPLVLVSVVAVISVVAAAACYVPSRRLLAGNPVAALRHD